jgi:hypothetical protein
MKFRRRCVRGGDNRTGELFSYVNREARARRDHPLRAARTIVNEALSALEREFVALYSPIGRPSIPPEKGDAVAGVLFDQQPVADQVAAVTGGRHQPVYLGFGQILALPGAHYVIDLMPHYRRIQNRSAG